jgi:methionyl-tRNA synthetase
MSRILITSALPYINGIKHLGNLAGSMLPADVYARFMRLRGHEVLYICATDEHGTPAELAAAQAGQDVDAYCQEQHEIQKKAGAGFNLSYDFFGRSSSQSNHTLTQHFCQKLTKNDLIEERTDRMVYSVDDERFLPDRYVEGTCPHCAYEKARGDQCDNCGRLLNPTDLINPYSSVSGSRNIEVRDTQHLYLLQTKLEAKLKGFIDQKDHWPLLARSIAYKHLDEGLMDRGITRDLKWGIKVAYEGKTRPGFDSKVFYVWFDAPIAYISATEDYFLSLGQAQSYLNWWRRDQGAEDVRYVQFMGKDNVAFHTVSFPATLLGSGEDWTMVDTLKAFHWLNWYGGKFSTSQKRGVFMDAALEIQPSDVWRWYLISQSPEGSDSSFTWEQFQSITNKDLADVLGNFVNRIVKFTESKYEGLIPYGGEDGPMEKALDDNVTALLSEMADSFEAIEMRKSSQSLRRLWVLGNEYLQEAAPWSALKTDPVRAGVIVRKALNLVRLCAVTAQPILPNASLAISDMLNIALPQPWPSTNGAYELSHFEGGESIQSTEVLFKKIEDTDIATWSVRFGGASS